MGQAAPPYQVDIAELIEPEAVLGGGDSREVVGLETLVAEPHSFGHPAADPAVHQALAASRLTGGKEPVSQGAPCAQEEGPQPHGNGNHGESAFQEEMGPKQPPCAQGSGQGQKGPAPPPCGRTAVPEAPRVLSPQLHAGSLGAGAGLEFGMARV